MINAFEFLLKQIKKAQLKYRIFNGIISIVKLVSEVVYLYVNDIFKRYKLQIEDNKIYDPIRKKYIFLTPEERIRQQMLKFIMQRLNVPPNKIGVERSLSTLGDIGNKKRVDICIFGENTEILAIIECKADYIGRGESPYHQALDYVESLNVANYFVVDGWNIFAYHFDEKFAQFELLETLPTYSDMLQMNQSV